MNLFLDCEFTGLKTCPDIISLGIVTEQGSKFYAEFTDYKNPTEWVIENVLPHLTNKNFMIFDDSDEIIYFESDRYEIVNSLTIWLSQYSTCTIIVDTGFLDWLLFLDLFNWQLPKHVFYMPIDIATIFYIKNINPDITRLDYLDMDAIKHNALIDADITRLCFNKLMNGE